MKNIALLNNDGTAMGIGATDAEARQSALDAGVDADRVHELRIVRLTPASVAAIDAGNPDAVEIEE